MAPFIQVPPDSSGKLVDTLTPGSSAHRQIFVMGDGTSTSGLVTVTSSAGAKVFISSGTVTLSSATSLSSGTVTLSSAPTVNISSGVITLSSNPTVNVSSGVITLSSATSLSSGTVTLSSATSLSSGTVTLSSAIALSSGIVTLSSNPTVNVSSGVITLSSNPTVNISSGVVDVSGSVIQIQTISTALFYQSIINTSSGGLGATVTSSYGLGTNILAAVTLPISYSSTPIVRSVPTSSAAIAPIFAFNTNSTYIKLSSAPCTLWNLYITCTGSTAVTVNSPVARLYDATTSSVSLGTSIKCVLPAAVTGVYTSASPGSPSMGPGFMFSPYGMSFTSGLTLDFAVGATSTTAAQHTGTAASVTAILV